MDQINQVAALIASKTNILLTSHIRLDGDAVGSELALADGLRRLGKQAHIVNDGPVPDMYRFLPGTDRIKTSAPALRGDYDLVIVLDSSDLARLGDLGKALPKRVPILNIDHHASNEKFGDLAWVDAEASSVGEMIYRLLERLRLRVTTDAAINLYAAIATDTGRFLHTNTTPEALRIVAEFLESGVDLSEVNGVLYRSISPGLLKLRAMAAQAISFFADGRIACMRLTLRMFAETGTDPLDTQEFIEVPRSIKGVSVAVLCYEIEDGRRTKVSLRANRDVDVCAIARQFNGGGHVRAAGCEIDACIDEAQSMVLEAVEAALCHPAR